MSLLLFWSWNFTFIELYIYIILIIIKFAHNWLIINAFDLTFASLSSLSHISCIGIVQNVFFGGDGIVQNMLSHNIGITWELGHCRLVATKIDPFYNGSQYYKGKFIYLAFIFVFRLLPINIIKIFCPVDMLACVGHRPSLGDSWYPASLSGISDI